MSGQTNVLEHLRQALQSVAQQHAPSARFNIEAAMSEHPAVTGYLTSAKHAVGQKLWSAARYDIDSAISELQHR